MHRLCSHLEPVKPERNLSLSVPYGADKPSLTNPDRQRERERYIYIFMYRQGPEVLPTLSLGLLFILGLLNNVPPKTPCFLFPETLPDAFFRSLSKNPMKIIVNTPLLHDQASGAGLKVRRGISILHAPRAGRWVISGGLVLEQCCFRGFFSR